MEEPVNGFKFPIPIEEKIIETGFMKEVMNRTLVIHPGNSVWYGESRIGKTTTARYVVEKITEAYDPYNPYAFRAAHYEVGEIPSWSGNEQKRGLKSLYNATLGRIDEGLYRVDMAETIAEQLILGLTRKNIQIIFVDEAGNLSLEAIRGMLMAYDAAKNMGHPLSFVFVGMDDLPVKVTKLPQVKGRIHEWCYFQPYSFEDVFDFLCEINPHFEHLDRNDPKQAEQVECIYEMFGGFPGLIIPFLRKLERYQQIDAEEITVPYLRTIHLRTMLDQKNSINKSQEIFGYKSRQQKQK
jgi:AAA+ ATPase superfamily predicted ATPase